MAALRGHGRGPWPRRLAAGLAVISGAVVLLELGVRAFVEWPLEADFFGSIPRSAVPAEQSRHGVVVATGAGWAHLGWIANPEDEAYRIERKLDDRWNHVGSATLGSWLVRGSGAYRVWSVPKRSGPARLIGAVKVDIPGGAAPPLLVPRIGGPWRTLFRPAQAGDYVNDHCIYQDAAGHWRLAGITSKGTGDYSKETAFAAGTSPDFPPAAGMREEAPIDGFGDLAWAPHVVREASTYYMFWSPHRLHRLTSPDGINWTDHRIVMSAPAHKFFRDAAILKVAEGHWLLYSTARTAYFSQVDLYQSFDLQGWQYIGAALRTGWGSERNAIVASTESPFVTVYRGRYYLFLTYNNDSFFLPAVLLPLRIWLDPPSYNDTLVFHSDNPFDFGEYRGRSRSFSLVTRLEAHASEIVRQPDTDAWYITTAGWPWAATLTSGEVAVAPLLWESPGTEPTAGGD